MRNTFVDYRCRGGRKRRRFPAPKNELQGEKGQAARAGGIPRSAARGTEEYDLQGKNLLISGDCVCEVRSQSRIPGLAEA